MAMSCTAGLSVLFLLLCLSCLQYQAFLILSLDWFDVSSLRAFALLCIFVLNSQQSSVSRQITQTLLRLMFDVYLCH